MSEIRAVVIDDEFFNRGLITMLIKRFKPSFVIAAEAASLREGYAVIGKMRPHVVFLDIKMPDGNGFDLLRMFGERDFEVVFVTGFDEYNVKALEMQALDYVLKPIDLDKFRQTLDLVETRIRSTHNLTGE